MKQNYFKTLLASLVALLVSVSANAEIYSGTCGDNLTWQLDSDTGVLNIEGTGNMVDYYDYDSPWYWYRNYLKSAIIAEGVTSIGAKAFSYCSGLTSVTIPESVTSIGDGAFCNSSGLTSVTFAEGSKLTVIGNSAFQGCSGLTSITIPSDVTAIGSYVFSGDRILCYATTPPAIGNGSNNTYVFVPRASIEAYKATDGWKDMKSILAIEDYGLIHPSLGRSDVRFYDYDGDGVMDMFGYYYIKNGYTNVSGYAWMNDDAVLYAQSFSKDIYGSKDEFKMANPNGDLSLGNLILKTDGSIFDATSQTGSTYIIYKNVDIDNDGTVELLANSSGKLTVLRSRTDGTFEKSDIRIVQDSAYIAYQRSLIKKPSPLDMSGMIVPGVYNVTASSGIARAIDLNDDGWLDLLSSDGKSAYMSLGNNEYYQILFTGSIYPYDLDGDGILDYLLYDGNSIYTVIIDAMGQSTQKRIFDNKNVKEYICRDFDHDGDVDVLVYITDNVNTYFVFMRNDGDGAFKKKESYLEGVYTFRDCRDYDADGQYEVLLWNYSNGNWNDPAHKIVKVNKDLSLTDASEDFEEGAASMKMFLGDYDNDGYTDMKLTRSGSINSLDALMTGRYSKQEKQNSAPQKMASPTVMLDESTGFIRITWERGADAETSSCDLTYEVRIGTAPGKDDVLCAPSLPDGRRRVVTDGSMGTQLQTLFNIRTHNPGTYYISVQAIDAGGRGSAWSDDAVYEYHPTAPLIMANLLAATTADTVTVTANRHDGDAIYRWSVTNGEVVSQEANRAQVVFHAAGYQQVMLTSQYGDAEYVSEPLIINVNAFAYTGEKVFAPNVLFDINQDGYPDGVSKNNYFYINDGKGNMSKYPKSFNSDLSLLYASAIDLNRDGFPDVIDRNGSYINDEEGDFERDSEMKIPESVSNYSWIDLLNTGTYVCCALGSYSNLWITDNYKEYSHAMSIDSNSQFYDFNRDGFMDYVYYNYYRDDNRPLYYKIMLSLNNGNGTFQDILLCEDPAGGIYSYRSYRMADINNDGYMDIIGCANSGFEPLRIYLGQPDYTFTLALEIGSGHGIEDIRDFDNNGYLDVKFGSSIIYFDHDLQYQIVEYASPVYDPFVVLDGDGYPQGISGSYNYRNLSSIKNETPKAPGMVSVKQTLEGMVINWSDAEDDHTPGVQMRYNISVKRKGKRGENSYLISPMNGGDSKAALVFPNYYKQSTTMTVPNSALTVGDTYEVQVQAIDLWNQWSPMSEAVEITITAQDGIIEAPDIACAGRVTTIRYIGALSVNENVDFGEDAQYERDGLNFYVTWPANATGVRDITIGNVHSQIIVERPVDVTFSLPDEIFAGAELPITINEELASKGDKGVFSFLSTPDRAKTSVSYNRSEGLALLNFDKVGEYLVESRYDDELLHNNASMIFVAQEAPESAITRVDVEDNHYVISWRTSDMPSSVRKVIIYKEGTSLNQYNVLDTVDLAAGRYADLMSSPRNVSERYKIALLSDGGQRFESAVHKPLHVMIGTSATGGYNLMWNAYEGLEVDNYRIWRGTSADNLQLVAQVAGSQQNYTDTSAPSGEVFYAVSFTPTSDAFVKGARRAPARDNDVMSNVVSTSQAVTLILANSLSIVSLTDDPSLTDESPTLQLYSLLLPSYCTYDRVAWQIVEGKDLAEISSTGMLTAKVGTGTVKVRVSSLDGSNLSDEITVSVSVSGITGEGNGDANCDGKVTITDAVAVVNYILGTQQGSFSAAAADIDGNGSITITDAVGIVNIILNTDSAGVKERREREEVTTERDPD